jgi:hypothetical protein
MMFSRCVLDLRGLVKNDNEWLENNVYGTTLRRYHEEQFTTVLLKHYQKKAIICRHAFLGDVGSNKGKYFDPNTGVDFIFHYINGVRERV